MKHGPYVKRLSVRAKIFCVQSEETADYADTRGSFKDNHESHEWPRIQEAPIRNTNVPDLRGTRRFVRSAAANAIDVGRFIGILTGDNRGNREPEFTSVLSVCSCKNPFVIRVSSAFGA